MLYRLKSPSVGWLALAAGVAVASACSGGALRQARLMREANESKREVLGPIAVGSTITPRIDFSMRGSGGLPATLVAARPDVLSARGQFLTGTAPGVSAVLIRADDGTVLDYVHLWVVEASHISLELLGDDRRPQGEVLDSVELAVGESVRLRPVIYAGNQALAGEAESAWQVDAAVAEVLRDGAPSRRRLIARAPGRATVSVRALGLESTFELVVVPQ